MSHLPAPLDISNNLPQEILNLVVYHARFDHNSLLNLCLTSPFFHHEAQRHLYYELRIANDGRPAIGPSRALTVDVAKAIQLFSTLTQYNTALARHVQILYHCVIPQGACSEYWTLMNKSLVLMYNLKKLTLYRRIPPCIFEGCTSFQLRNIECSHPCVDPSFRAAFLDFLATQPNIKSLFMAWDPDIPFPTTHCRNLTSLAGDRCTIEQVLPGREFTIKKLTWVPAREEDPGVNIIASRLSRIHVLSLGGYHVRPNLISLVPYLRSLQILRLIGVAPNVKILHEFDHIPDLPCLRVFVWSCSSSTSISWAHEPLPREKQQEIVGRWFRKMKSLHVAYFQTGNSKITPDSCYLPWFS